MLLIVVVISSFVTISSCASGIWHYYEDQVRWRNDEYAKIRELHGGISIARVEELLGSPMFVRASPDGGLTEMSFKARDYWLQAVQDPAGTVKLLAVTSCDLRFKPKIESPLGTIVLNQSTFDTPAEKPKSVRYSLAAATGNSFFIDEYYLGNPGYYKTYFTGINDACPTPSNYAEDLALSGGPLLHEALSPYVPRFGERESPLKDKAAYDPTNQLLTEFRSRSVVNTYAESDVASFEDVDVIINTFQVGVDRIHTRTTGLGNR